MTHHVSDDLPSLLTGHLARDQTAQVVGHLTDCDTCRRDLVAIAAASGVLRYSVREFPGGASHAAVPVPDHASLPPLPSLQRRAPRRRLLAGAAAVAVLVTAGGIALATREPGSAPPVPAVVATAALTSPAGSGARGVVTMRRPGQRTDMTVSTVGLAAPRPGQFYEVWLFDPATSKMVGIGVLDPDGRSSFRVPDGLITAYRAVDVSLQRDNGDPRHSSTSVLRGRYS